MRWRAKPKLAVFKFASCDGCQLSLLDCEDELLAVVGEVQIANFLEASREVVKGPYDLTLVEGSITTPHDAERIQQVRKQSRFLVTIGACATAGGIQALRNFKDVREFTAAVYATPEYISTLERLDARSPSTCGWTSSCAAARSARRSSSRCSGAFLRGRRPNIPTYSVCLECKRRGTVCVMVAHGTPCLGPGHPGRLRRDLPVLPPRLLRLLRPHRVAEHRRPSAAGGSSTSARAGPTSSGPSAPSTPTRAPFRTASDAYDHERT